MLGAKLGASFRRLTVGDPLLPPQVEAAPGIHGDLTPKLDQRRIGALLIKKEG